MNPGNGLPLFPSEQFCSLHVIYWEPAVGRAKEKFINRYINTNVTFSVSSILGLSITYADGILSQFLDTKQNKIIIIIYKPSEVSVCAH